MTSVARTAYRYLASLFLVGVIIEFFLAGLGVFRTQAAATKAGTTLTTAAFNHSFGAHEVVGSALGVVSLALVGCAFLQPGSDEEVCSSSSDYCSPSWCNLRSPTPVPLGCAHCIQCWD